MSQQCAVDPETNMLKDASDIVFYDSETSTVPLPPTASGRGMRNRNLMRFNHSVAAEMLDDDGQPIQHKEKSRHPRKKRKGIKSSNNGCTPEEDGSSFSDESSQSSSDSDADVNEVPSNEEVADVLLCKTIPETGHGSGKRKRPSGRCTVTIEEIQDEDSPSSRKSINARPCGIEDAQNSPKRSARKYNPIYKFYKAVGASEKGIVGEKGDAHWQCLHGSKRIITVWKTMKSCVTGLTSNLEKVSPHMYQLYLHLKERPGDQPITDEELNLASGKVTLSAAEIGPFLKKVRAERENIQSAFARQESKVLGEWDQEKFERLLVNWVVACDQPFSAVEDEEFRELLQYAHHSTSKFQVPGHNVIKRRVIKLSEEGVAATKKLFSELEGRISISLDAWTSPNNNAFLGIVAHYMNANGELEEILIDFRELIGEHSGDNMANAVWETLTLYGIQDRVMAFMLDNATNNDTFISGIVEHAKDNNIMLNANWIRLRCMPHTIHLAAMKLLEAIGAISCSESRRAMLRGGNYQLSILAPVNSDEDVFLEDNEDNDSENEAESDEPLKNVFSAVEKLRKIVRSIRSSPQRKQKWLSQLQGTIAGNTMDQNAEHKALMPILDVRTRWSSTHQMLTRALRYKEEFDTFASRYKDLRNLVLSDEDWSSVLVVSEWLVKFHRATTQMSATKQPMLSSMHAVFRGLQDQLKEALKKLPDMIAPQIKQGILNAHRKLSDYYYKFDQSPFYIWAALLDPRISYDSLKDDYMDEPDLLVYLEHAKALLHKHFDTHYANRSPQTVSQGPASLATNNFSTPDFDFTARYRTKLRQVTNELEEYFKLSLEDFYSCDPFKWWFGRRAQFPNLYFLATDILSIPGSAVAVERVFSGGRDTISLRRASLHAETVRSLMLAKNYLRVKRKD